MLRYFRINDPYRLIGLLVIFLILYLPLFIDLPAVTKPELKSFIIGEKLNEDKSMYTDLVDSTAPLTAWLFETMDSLFGRSLLARHIFAFILIFFQSAYLGIMFITRKVFNENTYIPSFLFSLLFFFSYDTLSLTGELFGLSFLLLALDNLFKELEFRVQQDETIFNLGLFISIASLFSFAFSIYLICAMVTLVFFTRSTLRKFLLLAFGFLLPHFFVITIAFLNNSLPKLWDYYYLANLGFTRETFISAKSLFMLGLLPLIYFVISVVMLQREARFSKYQSQVLQISFLWIGFSLLYILYCKDLRPQNLIVFIPALAFLFTHFFLFIRRKKFVSFNTLVLFLGIIIVSYLARYNKIKSIDYKELSAGRIQEGSPKNKRILVLENNERYFLQNRLATPYLNWNLSSDIFRNPVYYENVTEVYHALQFDPPDIIVDKENLLKPFLDQMPSIKKQYLRKEEFYVRVNN